MAELDVEHVGIKFGNFEALKDVSISAADGEFITLLGPSGCGKTTLLNAIAGFLKPSSGQISVDGIDVTDTPPEKRNSAMCFQSYALFPHLSVADNVAFGPKQKRETPSTIFDRVENLLQKLGLQAHASKLPNALSGGQQQRVALARALAVAPKLVLFDEPLSNLDAKLRDQVRKEIKSLQREFGFTAIYVTHDQTEALALSDRIYLLNAGRVEQFGSPEEIYFQPKTRFVADFIGAANIHDGNLVDGTVQTPFGSIQVNGRDQKNATVIWRPEMVELGGQLKGTVTEIAFQGAYVDAFVSAGDQTVRMQIPGTSNLQVGVELNFGVAIKNVVLLPEQNNG